MIAARTHTPAVLSGFSPAVVVQRWRTLSAVNTTFCFLRRDKAARAALSGGHAIQLPPMSPAAVSVGMFALIVPVRTGYAWLLTSDDWRRETEAEAAEIIDVLTAPGAPMEGREMLVMSLATFLLKGGPA